ncbi:MAG: glycosyl transferase [Bacteroidetes bacterium]|nr:glycosyl transferase [Bacteroidota bacterium]MDF2453126.1 glycosyl transferase [Bacteroidota bacterium]
MVYLFLILFLLSLLVPLFSYVIFPVYMKLSTDSIPQVKNDYAGISEWPGITVVFSVFNEEKVIRRKLESLLNSDYPKDKLQVLIGSDNSTDQTNAIIEEFITQHPNIILEKKKIRHGKLKIINELVDKTETEHLIFTDANVFFEPQTIKALVYNLLMKEAKMVCGNIHKFSPKNLGISDQEIFYMNFENQLKYQESLKYGFCVGVEGGCYAIMKSSFVKVPDGFLMDDFFITLDVISKKGRVLFEPEALCYEDVNDAPLIEFKRKIRISLGNFRNLSYYKHLLFPIYKGFGFAFLSHKVLRWFTPFALLFSFVFSLAIAFYIPAFILISACYSLLIIFPTMAIYLEKINFKVPLVNSLGHFILMNLGLLLGYFKFISASNESAWEPPKRNV